MTEAERIDRELLLRRAVSLAGAGYVAPLLTSAAAAGSDGCLNFTCSKKKKKWKKKHRKKCQNSGAGCDCAAPGTPCSSVGGPCVENCTKSDPNACSGLQACGTGGHCACFAKGSQSDCANAPQGHCIFLTEGTCESHQDRYGSCPGGNDSECAAGLVCFSSCCDCFHGLPPLCAECCRSRTAPLSGPSRSSGGGPRPYLV